MDLTVAVSVSEALSTQMSEFPQAIVHMKSPPEIFALFPHPLLHFRFDNRQLLQDSQPTYSVELSNECCVVAA
jgi:hypothetical protein